MATVATLILQRSNPDHLVLLKQTEKGFKNAFNWSWLERTLNVKVGLPGRDSVKIFLGDTIRKINEPGKALCDLCKDQIKYGSQGAVAIQ